jgi:hypothetical protein
VQLVQSQKMQAVGQLAGGMAHDFNNVLTAIIGFSDLLLARHRPTDPAFADIMNIKQNANRAANLVRQLLAFSRRQTLRPEVLSLTDILSDLGQLLGRLLGEKVELKVIHGRDLWLVKVDVNQFEQVIINLAVNGRDAMPDGGVLTVRTANVSWEDSKKVRSRIDMPPGEYVLCEVEDTGTGMSPEVIAKMYEPFFSTKDVGKGTGLGLSTVYGIVSQTGGYIFCDSEVGKGTRFCIYLPRHAEEAAAVPSRARTSGTPTAPISPAGHNPAGRGRGRGALVCLARAGLARLHGAGGRKRRARAGTGGRGQHDRPGALRRGDAGDGRADAAEGAAQTRHRHQGGVHFRLCRGRLRPQPRRPVRFRVSAQAVQPQAARRGGQGSDGLMIAEEPLMSRDE